MLVVPIRHAIARFPLLSSQLPLPSTTGLHSSSSTFPFAVGPTRCLLFFQIQCLGYPSLFRFVHIVFSDFSSATLLLMVSLAFLASDLFPIPSNESLVSSLSISTNHPLHLWPTTIFLFIHHWLSILHVLLISHPLSSLLFWPCVRR